MKQTRVSAKDGMEKYRKDLLEARKKGLIPKIDLPNWMKNSRQE